MESEMLQRLTINLSKLEQQALERIATIELRDMRDQARFIVRQELERRGLLKAELTIVIPITVEDTQPEQGIHDVDT